MLKITSLKLPPAPVLQDRGLTPAIRKRSQQRLTPADEHR